mmetsp:Transcript_968/g.2787  ORF Transcript_968/g.2787 Transcript_968/m.2787 type:complete len:161 (-) Transcript_968:136-618(-)|eukprot:CAMPEP_0177196988 /NCGR_PEP_ID=MMETSP0367-20130122/24334_1 /TAXON_ID=447022 ORGANISM="Scrippsiella hangoei-like, Strain SHHI-4" /NCGR_SAMPLE_ID=MMETSP0367 /ASSEMBLY_ACC=CAM_ASM_000362 /LENGTH=160 /DNA_ID=CAMNT_0018645107 /DNA_START=68 /DNA_END=550 /DNA_ORIENTATION=-
MAAALLRSAALRRAVAPSMLPAVQSFSRPMGCRLFSDMKFVKTHEWVRSKDGVSILGITDFAQGALGEVVYCDLPEAGAKFKGKETICTLESVKAVGEVYAPADCEVVEVNEKLADVPATVNSSPEQDGWLIKVKFSGDLSGLMDRAAYDKHVEAEAKEE